MGRHYVQFYKADEPLLNRSVGQYLWEGMLRGDGLLIIAAAERRESLAGHLQRLGVDVTGAVRDRQLALLDVGESLAGCMPPGQPDMGCFEAAMEEALRRVQPRASNASVRAYGEMVGVLWQAGQRGAALEMESAWNRLLKTRNFTLFCGYPIDVFGGEIESEGCAEVLRAHTHVMPPASAPEFDSALQWAMREALGPQAAEVRSAMTDGPAQDVERPRAEAVIRWLRKNLPERAEAILARAGNYYAAAQRGSG